MIVTFTTCSNWFTQAREEHSLKLQALKQKIKKPRLLDFQAMVAAVYLSTLGFARRTYAYLRVQPVAVSLQQAASLSLHFRSWARSKVTFVIRSMGLSSPATRQPYPEIALALMIVKRPSPRTWYRELVSGCISPPQLTTMVAAQWLQWWHGCGFPRP